MLSALFGPILALHLLCYQAGEQVVSIQLTYDVAVHHAHRTISVQTNNVPSQTES